MHNYIMHSCSSLVRSVCVLTRGYGALHINDYALFHCIGVFLIRASRGSTHTLWRQSLRSSPTLSSDASFLYLPLNPRLPRWIALQSSVTQLHARVHNTTAEGHDSNEMRTVAEQRVVAGRRVAQLYETCWSSGSASSDTVSTWRLCAVSRNRFSQFQQD